MSKKFARAYVREVSDKTDGLLTGAIGSTAAVDRYGESIDQSSWDLKHYKKNPVILWAHNLTLGEDRPPIGKATKVKVVDDQLTFDIQFDMADPFAADIFRKYKDGFLSAFSVGFIPHKVEMSDDNDYPVLRDNELLELSAVPVPANPEALNQLRARSFHSRSWGTMMKEVESTQDKDDEALEEEPKNDAEPESDPKDETPDAPAEVASPANPSETPAEEPEPKTDSIVPVAAKKGTNGNGSPAEPIKSKLGSNPRQKLARAARLATRLLQDALTEINRENKNS